MPRPAPTRAVREHREPAVLASEIMQLDRWTGYLKVATQKHWLKGKRSFSAGGVRR